MRNSRRAFTLIEMLIVIAIIAILAALIFPSFSAARENARQKSCSSNLREIGLAVQMYRVEEKEYPMSLAALLPASTAPVSAASTRLNNDDDPTSVAPVTAPTPEYIDDNTTDGACDNTTTKTCPNVGGTGYLRDTSYLLCPNDRSTSTQPRSSYGDVSTGISDLVFNTPPASAEDLARRTWNFWGYGPNGVAYNNQVAAQAQNSNAATPDLTPVNPLLVNPQQPFSDLGSTSPRPNVVKNSLSNRFAPSNTIVTYCAYHRVYSSRISSPEKLYDATDTSVKNGARDLILRLDGTVKSVVVSSWNTDGMWQQQNFR